jgi:hypothetical protein
MRKSSGRDSAFEHLVSKIHREWLAANSPGGDPWNVVALSGQVRRPPAGQSVPTTAAVPSSPGQVRRPPAQSS